MNTAAKERRVVNCETTARYLDGSYLEHNATWHVEDSSWKAKQIASILSKNQVMPLSIGEVGCGAGEILRQLSLTLPNARFVGYELSPQAFQLCASRASDRISFKCCDIAAEDVELDLLLCIDVFEHVEDYFGFIRSLKPKASYKVFHIPLDLSVLALLTGSIVRNRATFGHLHYFMRETAISTLEDCGYEVIDHQFTPFFRELPAASIKSKLARIPRELIYRISANWMSRLVGGCSLIVLAK